jgi:hypothetical protein
MDIHKGQEEYQHPRMFLESQDEGVATTVTELINLRYVVDFAAGSIHCGVSSFKLLG